MESVFQIIYTPNQRTSVTKTKHSRTSLRTMYRTLNCERRRQSGEAASELVNMEIASPRISPDF